MQLAAWNSYLQFGATAEARSGTHDIHYEQVTVNGVVDDANGPAASSGVPTENVRLFGLPYPGVVAQTEAAANSNFGLNVGAKSWQAIYDELNWDWASYETDTRVSLTNGQLRWPGTFTSPNTPLSLIHI